MFWTSEYYDLIDQFPSGYLLTLDIVLLNVAVESFLEATCYTFYKALRKFSTWVSD